jgi:hypothetical protein
MSKELKLWVIFACSILLVACSTKKKMVINNEQIQAPKQFNTKKTYEDEIKQVVLHSNNVNWYYTKATAKYDDGKQEIGLDLEIQMEKSKEIWINVKAMGFINVARILFQPDSIRILDYINRTYTSTTYQYLRNFTPLPIAYAQLENLIIGNVLFPLDVQSSHFVKVNNEAISYNQVNGFKQKTNYNNFMKVKQTMVQDSLQSQNLTIAYSQFVPENKNQFPGKINIQLQAEKNMIIEMVMNNLSFTKKRDWQLSVPKNYKVHVF